MHALERQFVAAAETRDLLQSLEKLAMDYGMKILEEQQREVLAERKRVLGSSRHAGSRGQYSSHPRGPRKARAGWIYIIVLMPNVKSETPRHRKYAHCGKQEERGPRVVL